MTVEADSFCAWLRHLINQVLLQKGAEPPFLIWCDPELVWKDLLLAASQDGSFELWADDNHELLLRECIYDAPAQPRVIWLPVARESISYFKIYELKAADVFEFTIPEALSSYGVDIPDELLAELKPLLTAHAKEWFNRPRSTWLGLTPGGARRTLVDDDFILEILAKPGMTFDDLSAKNLFNIFSHRVTVDFGLPKPQEKAPDEWRLKSLAVLLCNEAAVICPGNPPGEHDRIIKDNVIRDRALKLLRKWQRSIDLLGYFEEQAIKADSQTTLQFWARNLEDIPQPLASPAAEAALFQKEVELVASFSDFASMVEYLDKHLTIYQNHARSFWGMLAKSKVNWIDLAGIADVASTLYQQAGIESGWHNLEDAVNWFTSSGWQVDQAGEVIFQENCELPGGLVGVRAKLRKAYMRHLDKVNTAFSEFLSHAGLETLNHLPFPGEIIAKIIEKAAAKEPVAVVVLDACRYDLGCRLADSLNKGEPTRRANIKAARAPLPSITALGMPFCLPVSSKKIRVRLPKEDNSWMVTVDGFAGNIVQMAARREWMKNTFKIKDKNIISVDDVLDTEKQDVINVRSLGKLIFVFGNVLDFEGHEGQLKLTGCEEHLDRYAKVLRRLRTGGYNWVVVATDHGFFHWEPEQDEIEQKPTGDAYWLSRRAIAGYNLQHPTALSLKVTGSDLECRVPRSVNAFKTYGGLGFFHGGATLQELIIPVIIAHWPKKARKIGVILKPVEQITSLNQLIELTPEAVQANLFGEVDENFLGRQVIVKVIYPESGKVIFKGKEAKLVQPGGDNVAIELVKVEGAEVSINTELLLKVLDADDEELLEQKTIFSKVELDEWD